MGNKKIGKWQKHLQAHPIYGVRDTLHISDKTELARRTREARLFPHNIPATTHRLPLRSPTAPQYLRTIAANNMDDRKGEEIDQKKHDGL